MQIQKHTYKIDDIARQAVACLYARRGRQFDSMTVERLKKWYDGFNYGDSECHDWQSSVLNEVYAGFQEARRYDVLSSAFRDWVFSTLSVGSAYIARFADVEDLYFTAFIERLTYMCGIISGYIMTQPLDSVDERLKVSPADFNADFIMDVYGAYPTRFLNDGILLVGIVRKGIGHIGDYVSFPYFFDSKDYGSYNNALINSVGEIMEVAMFGRRFTEVRAGDVCILSVKYNGILEKDNDYPYPFQISSTSPISDIRKASLEEREKEYADQYIARYWWDNNTLELSVSDRMYMETVRTTLGISEKRAKEIELDRIPQLLSKNSLECFEAVKKCLHEIDLQNFNGD